MTRAQFLDTWVIAIINHDIAREREKALIRAALIEHRALNNDETRRHVRPSFQDDETVRVPVLA